MNRVSSKQKRVRYRSKKSAKNATRHLKPGDHHDRDRKAAEKLRQFPNVARKTQGPFPKEREVALVGHYKNKRFVIQTGVDFERDNLAAKKDAWYWKIDKRPGRKPIPTETGLVETNAALSTGLAMVLAGLVRAGQMGQVRDIMRLAAEKGMAVLERRSGYIPTYMALHPDAEGTLSVHYGLSPVNPDKHVLVGISATGKRGRKGIRNMGDALISILRHDRAIGLPEHLLRLPKSKLKMAMVDWAVAEEMDRVVREELSRLPDGAALLDQAGKYQREAAEDWLLRYKQSKAGVEWLERRARVAEERTSKLISLIKEFAKLIRSNFLYKTLMKQLKGGWERFSELVTAAEEPNPSNPVPDLPEGDLDAAEATEPAEPGPDSTPAPAVAEAKLVGADGGATDVMSAFVASEPMGDTTAVVGVAHFGWAEDARQAELEAKAQALEAEVAKLRSDMEADRRKAAAELVAAEVAHARVAEAREAAETMKREAQKVAMMEKEAADEARQETELRLQRAMEKAQEEKNASEAQIAELKKELKGLRHLADLVRQFLDRLVSAKKMDAMLKAVGQNARDLFRSISKQVDREVPELDKDGPKK